jgi:hypothetical protein
MPREVPCSIRDRGTRQLMMGVNTLEFQFLAQSDNQHIIPLNRHPSTATSSNSLHHGQMRPILADCHNAENVGYYVMFSMDRLKM